MNVDPTWLRSYTIHSNSIEGIERTPQRLLAEIHALEAFLSHASLGTHELLGYLSVVEPGARLRLDGESMRVGAHVAPSGGPHIIREVAEFLTALSAKDMPNPLFAYVAWEYLHPLTDGNGRTGRALYAWYTINKFGYCPRASFLEEFHYAMLGSLDKGTSKGWRGLAFV